MAVSILFYFHCIEFQSNEREISFHEYDSTKGIQMDDDSRHLVGTFLISLGTILLLVFSLSPNLYYLSIYTRTPPYRIDYFILPSLFFLAFSMISVGIVVLRKFKPRQLYVTRTGKIIHLARSWKKTSDEELFLTSCELVVSTNENSTETAHSGYHVITADQATCNECSIKDGRRILAVMRYYREG